MMETIRGDVLTTVEINQRGITITTSERGGFEMRAPTYTKTIAHVLTERGFLEHEHIEAACDYLELKNCEYGFLNTRTMAAIFKTGGQGVNRNYANEAYAAAKKHLGVRDARLISDALEGKADDSLNSIAVVLAYQSAFDRCLKAMEIAVSTVREFMQKEVA